MIGGWAIIDNGNSTYSWAHGGTSGTNAISAAATTATLSSTANWTGGTLTASSTVNSVIETGDIKLGGFTLTVASGGIILQGANFWMQNGGSLTSGLGSGELFVHSPNATLTDEELYVNIVNNGSTPLILEKDGPGLAYVTGANTYTGGTIINGGLLGISSNTHAGGSLGSVNAPLTINSGTLSLGSNYNATTAAASLGVGSLNGSSSALDHQRQHLGPLRPLPWAITTAAAALPVS